MNQSTHSCKSCTSLSIKNVIPDPCGSSTFSFPGYSDTAAVIEQCAAGRVRRWIDQQIRSDDTCPYPAVSISWPVALAVTPPRELTRPSLSALINDGAGRSGKVPTPSAIKDRPTDRDHAAATLSPCFPVQRKGETVVFVFLASRVGIIGPRRQHENYHSRQYYAFHKHIVLAISRPCKINNRQGGRYFPATEVNTH